MSDNEIYLLIKYIKSVLWKVAKRLSYIEDARCLNVITFTAIRTAFPVPVCKELTNAQQHCVQILYRTAPKYDSTETDSINPPHPPPQANCSVYCGRFYDTHKNLTNIVDISYTEFLSKLHE